MNTKKIVWLTVISLILILVFVWSYCETAGSDSYNYQGYIIAMRETPKGTVITTISGDQKAEFTIKGYTREKFNGDLTELEEGAFIRLSTTLGNSANVKKFSAYSGFSMEGKIVFMEGLSSPFILTFDESINYNMLYSLISSQDIQYPLQTGSQVKVYYQYPLNASTKTIVVDVIELTSDILSEVTEAEVAYIARQGYTVASNA